MQGGMVQHAHGLAGSRTPSASQLPQVCSAKLSATVFSHGKCLSALPAFHGSTGKAAPGEMLPEVRLVLQKSCVEFKTTHMFSVPCLFKQL